MEIPDASPAPRCPRCGYDQRGVVAQWTTACPLAGVCAECGLSFAWAELLSADRRLPRWCVEYAPRWYVVPWRALRTLLLTCRPWRFWSDLRMAHPTRVGHVLAYLALLTVPLYLVFAVSCGATALATHASYARMGATGLPSAIRVTVQAAVWPWSRTSPGTMTFPGAGVVPYPAPASVIDFDFPVDAVTEQTAVLVVLVGLSAAGFAVLPVSRRRAKVRSVHIIRVALYALALVYVPLAGQVVASLIAQTQGLVAPANAVVLTSLAALPLLLIVWWSVATSKYLRMPHAWGVGLAVVVMAGLATALLVVGLMLLP